MYYSEDLISEVQSRNDIVDVVSGYVRLTKRGSTYFGLCPFHNEKSPSFSVTPKKQMYYCFGCGMGGNVFTFLMEYDSVTFPEAMRILAERAGIALPQGEYNESMRIEDQKKQRMLEIYKIAAQYYFKTLGTPAGARGYQYLKERGLTDEIIRSFGLGYAAASSGRGGLYEVLRQKGYGDEELRDSALFRVSERGISESFWNRVMFPIMDANSKVIAFGGRVMGTGEPKYLNSPETLIFDKSRNLYGLHAAKRSREKYMLICEGYMDVIALHQAGFTNAVAALGTAFTQRHSVILKRYVEEVILTFDSDGAGVKAALRALPILKDAGLMVRVLDLKPYKDPDEFIKNMGREAFEERIQKAKNSFLFEIDVLKRSVDLQDPEQKTRFHQQIAKKLLQFRDELMRTNYMEAVCREHMIAFPEMKKLVNRMSMSVVPADEAEEEEQIRVSAKQKKVQEKENSEKRSQRLLLTWLSEEPALYQRIATVLSPSDFTYPLYAEVAQYIFEQAQSGAVHPAQILNHFVEGDERYKEVAEVFHTTLSDELKLSEREKALQEVVVRIKSDRLDVIAKTTTDIKQLQEVIAQKASLAHLKF